MVRPFSRLKPEARQFCEQLLTERTIAWFVSDAGRLRAFLTWMMSNEQWAEAFYEWREGCAWWRALVEDDAKANGTYKPRPSKRSHKARARYKECPTND